MKHELSILILEDVATDAELMMRELRQRGIRFRANRVWTEADFLAALRKGAPDVILADYSLPSYDGLSALKLAGEVCPDVPFIFVSGSLGEETAVDALHHGATDYVLKQKLVRLGPAVERALRDAKQARERKHAEQTLAEHEEQFRAMFEMASIGMAQADPRTGRWLRVNEKMCVITGYSADELLRMRVSEITHPEDRQRDWDAFQRVVRGEASDYRMEKRYVGKDGSVVWVNVNMTVLRDADGHPQRTMATIEDITDRKRMEETNARLAMAVDQAAETIVITDARARIQYANPVFERITGYTREEAVGQNPRILKSGKHDAAFYRQMWDTLASGGVWEGRIVNRRKDGTLFVEEASISPVRDAAGTIVNYVGVKRDVSREVELEAQFRQAQKMESIGQLAGGVAHDFNNILTVILLEAEPGAVDESLPGETREALQHIKRSAERAASLTRQLLLFSSREIMQLKTLDLNVVVTDLGQMLRRILREDIDLKLGLCAKPLWIFADPGMLDQVLLNLSVNARDAMPAGGRLNIETYERTLDAEQARRIPDAAPGRYVRLSVGDSGCGIPPEILPRIFEPFFTTKGVGKGTGLGLATVFGIIKQHQGWTEVHSEAGKGTVFDIYIPATEANVGTEAPAPAKPHPQGGRETILLLEDEPSLRALARRILERQGYRVLEAACGQEALSVGIQDGSPIDLLLSDLILPGGMDGREVAAQLLTRRPNMKVAFMSGYSPELAGFALTLQPGQEFIPKPFTSDVLRQTVRRCLE